MLSAVLWTTPAWSQGEAPPPAAGPETPPGPADPAAPTGDPAPADPGAVAAPSPTGAPTEAPTQGPKESDAAFELRVKSLEERVTDLKEKIYRTKARLLLLQETVISGEVTSGAKAVLIHKNEMGASFVIESVAYALDGAPIFTKVDASGNLDKQETIELFNGRIVPGNHQVSVRLTLRGSGFGVFSYLEGYKFNVQSSHTFNAEAGKVTKIYITAFEKGGITTDLQDRPAVKYDREVTKEQAQRPGAAPAEAAP